VGLYLYEPNLHTKEAKCLFLYDWGQNLSTIIQGSRICR